MRSNWWVVLVTSLLIVVLAGCGSSLRAQSESTGALTGTITDPSGAAIPSATVTLVSSATGQTREMNAAANGTYRFSLLPPGTYSLKVSADGFKTS